ncbi:MAG: PAS domain-containing sensor histidine kinase, partial [bacterium]
LPALTFDPETGAILNFNPSYHKLVAGSTYPTATVNIFFLLNKEEKKLNSYLNKLKTNTTAAILVKITSGNLIRYYRLLSFLNPRNNSRALGLMIDITEQCQSEIDFRRRTESFLSIWENLATGVAIVDSQYTIQQANPWFARFYQTTPETLKGKKCHQLVHGLSHPCYLYGETCPIVNVLASGTVFRTKHQHLTPDGIVRYIETTVAPLHDENDTIIAFLMIHNDFTEIKLAQQAAEEKNRELEKLNEETQLQAEELKNANSELLRLSSAKDEFISTVSHELRTPLTVIAEVLNLLIDKTAGPIAEKQHQLLSVAHRNCSRLSTLINNLLDMSKLEINKIHVHPEEFDICLLIDEVKKSLSPVADQKGLSLTTVMSSEPIIVYADEKHIHRVLINLVGNAIKFTDQGRVTISVQRKETEAIVSVCDTGIGIPENEQPNIFEKFYQAHHYTGFRMPGTGLGLAITKKLLELNNSKIGLDSKPGVGSCFFFSLPLAGELASKIKKHESEQQQ